MAMQVKHMVTFGLGLGIVTAFGYHFLSSPQNNTDAIGTTQVTPLNRFEIAQPPVLAGPAPVPTQPQLDDHFRVEAQPLQSKTVRAIPPVQQQAPKTSYEELVSTMQPAFTPSANPVEQDLKEFEIDDSESGFSLDLSPPNEGVPEFAFEEDEQGVPQIETQLTQNTNELQLESLPADTSEAIELDVALTSQSADEILADDATFEASSAQSVPTQNQDESFTKVVDYNSQPIGGRGNTPKQKTQTSKDSNWISNPFINSAPATNSVAETIDSVDTRVDSDTVSILEVAQASTPKQAPVAQIESVSPAQTSSVLSLNDPSRDSVLISAEPVRPTSAATIPDTIQPYQRQAIANDQVSTQPVQIAPQVQLSLSNADAQKAVHHIEYGKTLSRRGAAFTARQEFLAAMQVIAASNDKASGDNRHTKALKMAMLTIREANDFSVANSEQQIHMDVASVVESHRSQVLSPAQASHLSPVQAMNRYFARAQEQLDLAGGRNVVSAEVFYCMGKLHTLLNRNQKVLGPYETAQSVVYHQAALLSDNHHHRSANELGVLLARSGRLEQSKMLFERSLMSQPTIRTWQNLAETHRRLGETDLANQAAAEVQMLANGQVPSANSNIQWKPVEVFNADAPIEFNQQQRVAQLPTLPKAKPETTPGKQSSPKTVAERLKRLF